MKKRQWQNWICAGLAAGLAGVTARAEPLAWPDCLVEAKSGNPDLAAARQAVEAAAAAARGRRSERLPQLSASGGYDRSGGSGSSASGNGRQDQYDAGLRASQVLYTGGRVSAEIGQSQAQLDEASAALRQTAATVSFDIKSAFARLLFAQDLSELTRNIVGRREENLQLVELRFEGGREHKGSYLRTRADTTQAHFEADQAQRALGVARRELARVLGRPGPENLAAQGPYDPVAPEDSPDFSALALITPLRDQAEARRRFAEAGLQRSRSEYFPEVSLAGSVDRNGQDFFPNDDRWSAGVALNFPFFPGGRNGHDVAGARASLRQAEAELRSREAEILKELEAAHAALLDGIEDIQVRQEFLESAQVRAEIARRQYTSGLLSFEDWDLIESDLINAQKSLLAVRREAVLAEAAWDLAKGKELFGEP